MRPDAAAHESLWIAPTEDPGFPVLDGPLEVDAAVVGAGVTGLTTALLLKTAGLRVAVIEASGICRGTCRRSGLYGPAMTRDPDAVRHSLRAGDSLGCACACSPVWTTSNHVPSGVPTLQN